MPSASEKAIQSAVLDHWNKLGVAGSLVAAIPNAGAFGQSGLTKGLPDLMVVSHRLEGRVGFIELKTDTGRLSGAQKEVGDILRSAGVPYTVTRGRDEPIDVLELWGAARPRAKQEAA